MKQFKNVLLPLGVMILAVVVCVALSEWLLPLGAILLLLQLACAISALVGSRLSGIIAGFVGALSFNYFFTAPLYSFRINQLEDSINFIVFMLVSLLINEVAAYVRKQQRALEVATTQSSMLRSVSHDLRTPLSTIIGSVETINTYGDKLQESEKHALLQGVLAEGRRLYAYIENLLQATRIEHNALAVNLESVPLVKVVSSLETRVNNSRLTVENSASHQFVTLSESLFEQALYNVIDNALKFSEHEVQLKVSDDENSVTFCVKDNGKGFSEAMLQKPFSLFQTEQPTDNGTKGIGLGLSVAKGIVEAHKGSISLQNNNAGGCVYIRLLKGHQYG